MNEDDISREMYRVAQTESEIEVLSWQGVSGKTYMTRDMRFRVGRDTQATDLVLIHGGELWLIEIKGSHAEAFAEDEPKLRLLRDTLSDGQLLQQVADRCKRLLPPLTPIRLAVAYSKGTAGKACDKEIAHLPWETYRPDLKRFLMHA